MEKFYFGVLRFDVILKRCFEVCIFLFLCFEILIFVLFKLFWLNGVNINVNCVDVVDVYFIFYVDNLIRYVKDIMIFNGYILIDRWFVIIKGVEIVLNNFLVFKKKKEKFLDLKKKRKIF